MTDGDSTGSTDPGTAVYQLSSEAFTLAQEAASGGGDKEAREKKARALNERLDELWPQIQAGPASADPGLNNAWSDARLDVGYVLSNGDLSPSTRLYYYLESLKNQPES
jgi:hypothetical protein